MAVTGVAGRAESAGALGAAGGIAFFGSSLVWDSIDRAPPWLVYPGAAALVVGSVGAFAMSFIRRRA